jgi:hypothetical protein
VRRACLEAISQAQRHLAERMQECADSLAAFSSISASTLTAEVLEGKWAQVRCPRRRLVINLSHVDGLLEPRLDRFRGQPIWPRDLADLIPDWPTLTWKRQPREKADLSLDQWAAASGDLRIELAQESGSNPHEHLVKLFLGLMNDD